MCLVVATIVVVAMTPDVNARDPGGKRVVAFGQESNAAKAKDEAEAARKVMFPANREYVLERLSRYAARTCKDPVLQEAARLTESRCRAHVLAAKDACKAEARVLIPGLVIQSRRQFWGELKTYMMCLIPPTGAAAPKHSGREVLAGSAGFSTAGSGV